MSTSITHEIRAKNTLFWKNATKYAASASEDEKFTEEIAYMMVTLHRTGA